MSTLAAQHATGSNCLGRYFAAGLVALFGIMASVGGYVAVTESQRHLAQLNLNNLATSHRQVIEADLANAIDLLQALQAYFDANKTVTREEYQLFAQRSRERMVGLRDTGWAPRVLREERAAFERKVRESGFPDFEIWERDAQGKRTRAGDRAEYFPILFPDPVEITAETLGFDCASEAVSADAMRRARITDWPTATLPIKLITQRSDGFISFMPVYRGDTRSNEQFAGFVFGVFETAPMIERILAVKTQPLGLDIYFYDPAGPVDHRLIHWHSSRTRSTPVPVPREAAMLAEPHWQDTLRVADQTWGVIFVPTEAMMAGALSFAALATLAMGLLMTGMIVAYLLVSVRRTVRLEALTDRVKAANDDLLALRTAFDDIDTGVMLVHDRLRVQFTNSAARQIWGLTEQALIDYPTLPELIFSAKDKTAADCPHVDLAGYLTGLLPTLRDVATSSQDRKLDNREVIRCQSVTLPGGGWMLSYSRVTDLVRQSEQLAELANADSMTGACNRRRFLELADAEWSRFAASGQALSLLLLDIDLFKSINDRFGHDIGDDVIRAVANTCFASLRTGHVLGRLGGEEFGLLLPQADLEQARGLAEHVRRQVETMGMRVAGQNVQVTVSIGVAQAGAGIPNLKALLKAADQALYDAKRSGRNRVSMAAFGVVLTASKKPAAPTTPAEGRRRELR